MTKSQAAIPRVVLIYGLLGVTPFWTLAAAARLAPDWTEVLSAVVGVYAALILSFLGGARWGMAVQAPAPNPVVVGLAMTPTLAGLTLIALAHGNPRPQLLGLAAALAWSCAWDLRARALPAWYGRLRVLLTFGAVGGLVAGALIPQG